MVNYSNIICRFVKCLSLGRACNLCDTHGPSGIAAQTVMAVAAGSSMNMAELEKRRLCPRFSLSYEISGKQVYCLWCGSQRAIWQDLRLEDHAFWIMVLQAASGSAAFGAPIAAGTLTISPAAGSRSRTTLGSCKPRLMTSSESNT